MTNRISWILCAVAALQTSAAIAQSSAGGESASGGARDVLETITVTARKRAESLQDVPVTVAVVSGAELANNAATDLQTIAELAPQVIIGRSVTGTGAVLGIRGISSAAVDSGLDQSVAIDIDGVALSRGRIVEAAQFDLKQVEVLEGPQALFFGKNSPAGVISIDSNDPTRSFQASARGGYEFEADERYGEMAISGPLTNNLTARFAFRGSAMDGWIRNVAPAEPNPFQPDQPLPGALQGASGPAGHSYAGRFTLLWEPTEDFTAKLKITGSSERLNSNSAYDDNYCSNGQTVPTTLGVPQTHGTCALNAVTAQNALPPAFAVNFPYANGGVPYAHSGLGLASLQLNKTFTGVTLASTTGYYDQDHSGANTADYGEFVQIYGTEDERYRLFNEELRLNTTFSGPVNAMAGLYYEYSSRNWTNVPDILHVYNPVDNNYFTSVGTADNTGRSYSGFGQIRWDILQSLTFEAGARYTHDIKHSTLENYLNNPAAAAFGIILYPNNTPLYANYSGNNVSPEVTLTWKPGADQTLFASFKTGYKSGGISNQDLLPSSATATNVLFGPEKTHGVEVGYKADLLAHTLRVALTAYRYDYNGLQVSAYNPLTFSANIQNAAKARTQGITGLMEWLAGDHLSFNGNIGWNRARYLSFPDAPCYLSQTVAEGCVAGAQSLAGQALNRAPNVTFKLGGDYKLNLFNGWKADFSLSGDYSGAYQTETNYDPAAIQSSYWLLNSALRFLSPTERYQVAIIGRDLTNTIYKVVTYNQSFGTDYQFNSFINRPREIILEVGVKL